MRLDPHRPAHLLVTGGGGFVGGNFVRLGLETRPAWRFTVLDHLGGRPEVPVLDGLVTRYPHRFQLVLGTLDDAESLRALLGRDPADAVVHFAAKNPSGREDVSPLDYTRVNVLGTATLLDAVRWSAGGSRVLHLSSYEVYGSHSEGLFTESTPLRPTTPYAASKASADALTLAYHRTFGLDALVTRTTNIYGPFQSPDKLIPSLAAKASRGEGMPVYGSGGQTRDWIHVDDHNRGALAVLERGRAGEVYHLGARCERSNLDMALAIADAMARALALPEGSLRALVTQVRDRAAHDPRRALDTGKVERELGFRPEIPFDEGLQQTVDDLTEALCAGEGR
jgi:dTDP-glucose 4,6-dehydratase